MHDTQTHWHIILCVFLLHTFIHIIQAFSWYTLCQLLPMQSAIALESHTATQKTLMIVGDCLWFLLSELCVVSLSLICKPLGSLYNIVYTHTHMRRSIRNNFLFIFICRTFNFSDTISLFIAHTYIHFIAPHSLFTPPVLLPCSVYVHYMQKSQSSNAP